MPCGKIVRAEEGLAKIAREMAVVAVVGMKDDSDAGAPAFLIPRRVQESGVRVIPVNPKLEMALGEKAYDSLANVPDRFDMVNVFRRSEAVEGLADEILALPENRWPRIVWMQTGVENAKAAAKLTLAGIDVVMDACLAVYAARYRGQ